MQYENYEKKVARIEKALKFVFRHLGLFLLGFGIVLAGIATLLGTKGIITENSSCPESIIYGEGLDYEAKAFISDVQYEYSPKGKDKWSTEFPKDPGEYEVRAAAKALFGYRYGEEQTFTVLPRETNVDIASRDVIYGNDPALSLSLAYGDRVGEAHFDYNEDRTVARLDPDSIVIVDEKGTDVTDRYSLKMNATEWKIITRDRPLTVSSESAEKVYDGTALTNYKYTVTSGALASTDTLNVTFNGTITNVGNAKNYFSCTVTNKDGEDVTHFYLIVMNEGDLSVTRRPITLQTDSLSVMYDGKTHTKEEYTVEAGELASNQKIEVQRWASLTDVGTKNNELSLKIRDARGDDVTPYYQIEYKWGTLEVTQRDILITTGSDTWTYDGAEHTCEEYDVKGSGLASTDRIAFAEWPSMRTYSQVPRVNEPIFSIVNSEGVNVTSNYKISKEWGLINVSKKAITVTTPTESLVYNGEDQSASELLGGADLAYGDSFKINSYATIKNVGAIANVIDFAIVSGDGSDMTYCYEIVTITGNLSVTQRRLSVIVGTDTWVYDGAEHTGEHLISFDGEGPVSFHTYKAENLTVVKNVTDAVENRLTLSIFDGNENVSANYAISYKYGTLSVTKRPLEIVTATDSKVYDGTALSSDAYSAPNLVDGHKITVGSSTSVTDVGAWSNEFFEYKILSGDENVTDNYEVSFVYGTLTVDHRPVTVYTESASKVYDATPLVGEKWIVDEKTPLVSGHTLSAPKPFGTITDVGTVKNAYDGEILIFDGERDVTFNYEITDIVGELTVEPRPITVSTSDIVNVYDGREHSSGNITIVTVNGKLSLCVGHSIEVLNYTVFKGVIETENVVDFDIKYTDENGERKSALKNYDVTYEWGEVSITKRPITVASGKIELTYDANEHWDNNLTDASVGENTGLCIYPDDGVSHSFIVTYYPVFKDATVRDGVEIPYNDIEFYITDGSLDLSGNYTDVSDNYEIEFKSAEVLIYRLPITISTNSYIGVYDGLDHTNYAFIYEGDAGHELGNRGHGIKVLGYVTVKDATDGTVKNAVEYDIYDVYTEESVKHNYDITEKFGDINVSKRPISVYTDGYKGVYTGYVEATNEIRFKPDSPYGLCTDTEGNAIHYISSNDEYREFKNALETVYKNIVEIDILDENGDSVKRNYDIDAAFGEILIEKRHISVYTEGYTGVYDGFVHDKSELKFNTGTGLYGLCTDKYTGENLHEIEITFAYEIRNVVTDAENEVRFKIAHGNEDVTENYLIDKTYGKVNISPAKLVIETQSYSGLYDGIERELLTLIYKEGTKILGTDTLEITSYKSFCDAVENAKNEIEFTIYNGKEPVTFNYDLTVKFGTVNIAKRTLAIKTESYSGVYDGKEHATKIEIGGDGLCEGQHLDLSAYVPFKSATDGEVENSFEIKVISADGDVTHNYNVLTPEWGKVNITKRKITVKSESYVGVYDGKEHGTDIEIGGDGLCEGHTFAARALVPYKDVTNGEIDNRFAIVIFDENTKTVTSNYEMECTWGKINITKKPLTITNVSYDGMYDGNEHGGCVIVGICEGQSAVYVKKTMYINVTDGVQENDSKVYITDNTLDIDGNRVDVTENYEITYIPGTINITPLEIVISTKGMKWPYDGKEHSCPEFDIVSGTEFVSTHNVVVSGAPSIKDIGSKENRFTVTVLDENDEDIGRNYSISYQGYGIIEIEKREVHLETASDERVYNGNPLTAPSFVAVKDSLKLIYGHKATATFTGTITNPGTVSNTYLEDTLKIVDSDGKDVTHLYSVTVDKLGTLTVLESENPDEPDEPEEPENPGGSDKIDLSGEIKGGTNPSGSDGPIVYFTVSGDTTGGLYLKLQSYGGYNGRAWSPAPTYTALTDDGFSAYYLAALALANGGGGEANATITPKTEYFALPYYTLSGSFGVIPDDVYVNSDVSGSYSVKYFYQTGALSALPEEYKLYEEAYCDFVYKNYRDIDEETFAFMSAIIKEQGFSSSDPEIITKVAEYIKGCADYNTNYDKRLDDESNIVVSFMSTYGEGVCQHYASAATLMFRALDLPARYTVGFGGYTLENEEVEITSDILHAWVEVYVSGIGWIAVEVTGSPNDEEPPEEEPEITHIELYAPSASKEYDGTPLTLPEGTDFDTIDPTLQELLDKGYTYKVVFGGSQTKAGSSLSTIEYFELIDPNGVTVTDNYTYTYNDGSLRVSAITITIMLYEKRYEYDGTQKGYAPDEYMLLEGLPEGYELKIEAIKITATNVGTEPTLREINYSFREYFDFIVTYKGSDVTDGCQLVVDDMGEGSMYKPLEITLRSIKITTASAAKTYDGTALVANSFTVTYGSVVEGHQIYLECAGAQIDRGSSDNYYKASTFKVFDKGGNDVTRNYVNTIDGVADKDALSKIIILGKLTVS